MSPAKEKQAWHDRSDVFALGCANFRSGVPDSYVPDSPRFKSAAGHICALGEPDGDPEARQTNCSDASPSPRKDSKDSPSGQNFDIFILSKVRRTISC
ncbi:hypothetical protein PGT21_002634 [Puccinia graminis f. sp. tritici]|uniref:Uncharacterized protein n=1 Tax=Puccinia graminis f. sp. tritici TaxID=56615 RepID=A0A5B0PTL7_PUCGR|nr:hypothetical protein PGT21_002634 [Puccinia graminis f. sp. tritici]KAA1105127.1 hypothetical protein PGTUg99_014990 [Puccinia graminis f. sp. tritici]